MKIERIARFIIGCIFFILLALTIVIIFPIILPILIIDGKRTFKKVINNLRIKFLPRKKAYIDFI